jgi:branched-chain amino acid transport system ATP-binding protein
MLRLSQVQVRYDRAGLALDGVSLEIEEGHIVALLGRNGAGKSTTLKAISGLLASDGGRLTHGRIELDGRPIADLDAADVVRLGVFHVMEGRRVFGHLSVQDNLLAGAHTRRGGGVRADLQQMYDDFPRLAERRRQLAGYLSGGEQQVLAIARALMSRPRVIVLDEPSLGLAPVWVNSVFDIVQRVNRQSGTTILLVEQNAHLALRIASYAYVLDAGRVALEGDAREMLLNDSIRDVYLGRTRDAA